MDTRNLITAERLKELLEYDPETGVFRWREQGRRKRVVAGAPTPRGYILISIDRRSYSAHRLAWLYMTGAWPAEVIDHINGVPSDNRIANLRACTRSENQQNRKIDYRLKDHVQGVYFQPTTGKWSARIGVHGKKISLGCYKTREEAGLAYLEAKKKYHTFQPVPRELLANCA